MSLLSLTADRIDSSFTVKSGSPAKQICISHMEKSTVTAIDKTIWQILHDAFHCFLQQSASKWFINGLLWLSRFWRGKMSTGLKLLILRISRYSVLWYRGINHHEKEGIWSKKESWICETNVTLIYLNINIIFFYQFSWSSMILLNTFWIGYNKCLASMKQKTCDMFGIIQWSDVIE